jgi:hypothetical protein
VVDRALEGLFLAAALVVLAWIGAALHGDAGEVPAIEGPEVGGHEEAAEEVGGEEEALAAGDLDLLPEGDHRDLVIATCTTCHGAALVTSQRLSRAGWDETISWMQKEQALWDLAGEQRGQVLDYLAEHFGPRAVAVDSSPWAHPLYEPNPLW